MREKIERVSIVFYAILKDLDSSVGVMAVNILDVPVAPKAALAYLDSRLNTCSPSCVLIKFQASHSNPNTLSVHPGF